MYKTILIFMLSIINTAPPVSAQSDSDREKMNQLLKQRQDQFGSYAESIDQRSGIFGNKTKRDLNNSNEILTAIVRLDNKIMELLNRKLDYRTFETTSYDYDKQDYESKLQGLLKANETLEKKLASMETQSKKDRLSLKWSTMLNYLLGVLWVICGVAVLIRRLKSG